MWLIVLYFTNTWISETNEMWVIVLCFITAWNPETNDNVSERLMLLDYEFHTFLKYKTITHISFTSLTITSRSDQKTCSLKQTSNILIWINKYLMPSTAFSTSFRKLKIRVRIFQDISEMENPKLNFFPENYSSWISKQIYLLFIKKIKYVLNYRALKFQYIFSTFFQFFKNISKTVIDIAEVRRYLFKL